MKCPDLSIVKVHKMTVLELFDYFEKLSAQSVRRERFVFVPGDTRMPLLVAHADTVFHAPPKVIVYDEKRGALYSPEGLGADDRAGVFAILTLWANLTPKPALLLCDEEEVGARGAWDAAYEIYDMLQEFPYFIEIDRRGHGECVFYNNEGADFKHHVKSFGFREHWGIFSDISVLGEECKKCSVNLSAGYYNNHVSNEYLIIASLEYTIRKVKRMMLRALHTKNMHWKLPKPKYQRNFSRNWHRDWDCWDTYDKKGQVRGEPVDLVEAMDRPELFNEFDICEICGTTGQTYYTNLTFGWACEDCLQDYEKMGAL